MLMTMDIKVAGNGRMILPQSVRRAMGLQGESKVILTLENDEVRLTPIGHGVARARALYRQHARTDRTTDNFLADRREESALEAGNDADAADGAEKEA
ncbi:AbrB/MazE/SpoVT family DNA-binding domain-containing protein [Sphingomonas sp. WKB10]|jgi:AbrB family looped-hinge helix DNA binding protein|nr:AbrB/MazE/SpoVT family DNA-binding domain-containing protein [Sphingomonas sp. WKB10]